VDEVDDAEDLRDKYVVPFYRHLMADNALGATPELLDAVREKGSELQVGEVRRLLLGSWRPRVMGAWYSVAHPRAELGETVRLSLTGCQGRLTALPLLVSAIAHAGADTLAAIAAYEHQDRGHHWGADGVARAAAETLSRQLSIECPLPPATDDARRSMEGLLRVGRMLRGEA